MSLNDFSLFIIARCEHGNLLILQDAVQEQIKKYKLYENSTKDSKDIQRIHWQYEWYSEYAQDTQNKAELLNTGEIKRQ